MATYAIGDIHGCLPALELLVEHSQFQPDDTIVFLGDYVDRGPDTKGVIDFLLAFRKQHTALFIQGNHELMMLGARSNTTHLPSWLHFGGSEVLDSYGIGDTSDWEAEIPDQHWRFLQTCLPYYELGKYIFVHAGLLPGIPLDEQTRHILFWEKFVEPEPYHPERVVICGHTSRKNGQIANLGHTVCIDTYAYGDQWLSCLNVETGAFLQADNFGRVQRGQLA